MGTIGVVFIIHRVGYMHVLTIRFSGSLRHVDTLVTPRPCNVRTIRCYRRCNRWHDSFITPIRFPVSLIVLELTYGFYCSQCADSPPARPAPASRLASSRSRAHTADDRDDRVGSQGARHCGHLPDPSRVEHVEQTRLLGGSLD